MSNPRYSDKLKDPRWQKKRLEILQRDEWTCQNCFDKESTLHVHHKIYKRDIEPWDYPNYFLVTLCENCHNYEMSYRSINENVLLEILRSVFFADDIDQIQMGFQFLESHTTHKITASVIRWILSNEKLFDDLTRKYLEHLKNNSGIRK